MSKQQTGSCLCGGVSFQLSAGPLALTWCHCAMCRKFHGHAMPAVNVELAQLEWAAGAEANVLWHSSSKLGRRGSCRRCGSALFFREEGRPDIAIAAGALDNPTRVMVADHIYSVDKGDWYDLPDDGLPRHEGDSPDSAGA